MIPLFFSKIIKPIYNTFFKKDKVTYWINQFLLSQEVSVVQIGSNDGKTGDPLFKLIKKNKHWRSLFVEPVPFIFNRLKQNYLNETRFKFENSAINDGKEQNFYWVDPVAQESIKNLPSWYNQLGSFNKEHILKHLDGQLEPFIKMSKIHSLKLTQLFDKYQLYKIELLHVDTEGYDWKIISQLDFSKLIPSIILFEHVHLKKEENLQALKFLLSNYHIFSFKGDYLCLKRDLNQNEKTVLNRLRKIKNEVKIN